LFLFDALRLRDDDNRSASAAIMSPSQSTKPRPARIKILLALFHKQERAAGELERQHRANHLKPRRQSPIFATPAGLPPLPHAVSSSDATSAIRNALGCKSPNVR
jgi:hypothetical protein